MEIKITKKTLAVVLTILILLGWIVYGELMDWRLRTYNNGLQDGQLVLAADQLGRQEVTFFNGTFVQTIEIPELCQRLYGGKNVQKTE